jgi:hypothetical protein
VGTEPQQDEEDQVMFKVSTWIAAGFALATGAAAAPACADMVTRSVDVEATPEAIWALIGPFCAIKDWLPPVGTCTEDGRSPPTRTLVTKDAAATFVELQTERNDAAHFYTYQFQSSPLPVTHYKATIKVSSRGDGKATVTWRGTYSANPGKEKVASDALSGIYEAGLNSIKLKFSR